VIPALDLGSTKVDAVLVDAELTGSVSAFELRIWIEERPPEVTMILALLWQKFDCLFTEAVTALGATGRRRPG
jgi:hypothetical protein